MGNDVRMEYYLSNKARGDVVYGQYTTAKGCFYVQHNADCLVYFPCKLPYCYYILITNVIKEVKINVLSPVV
jgi:hypothetical protein